MSCECGTKINIGNITIDAVNMAGSCGQDDGSGGIAILPESISDNTIKLVGASANGDEALMRTGTFYLLDYFVTPGASHGLHITPENDPGSRNPYVIDKNGQFTFPVERKGSQEAMNWFYSEAGGRDHATEDTTANCNFALKGNLYLAYKMKNGTDYRARSFRNVVIGQFHEALYNWWIFGGIEWKWTNEIEGFLGYNASTVVNALRKVYVTGSDNFHAGNRDVFHIRDYQSYSDYVNEQH
jgi:hypothetical protein